MVRAAGWGDARNDSGASAILAEVGGRRKQPAAGVSNPMARETEIKLRISDVRAFHRALKRIGACPAGLGKSKVHEENVIFDTRRAALPSTDNCCAFERKRPKCEES